MCTGCRCASRCGGGRLAWMGRVGCRVPARALKIQLVSRGWGRLRTHDSVHRGDTLLQMHLLVLSSTHPMVQLPAIARICPPRNRARACSRPARPPPSHVSRARGGGGGAASPSVAFCHPRKKQHTATHTPKDENQVISRPRRSSARIARRGPQDLHIPHLKPT